MTDSLTVEPQDLWPANAGQGFLAVLDHLRTWERFDGPVRARIESEGGMTAYTAAAVSIEYGLMQSLPWKGGFNRFGTIAELVNRAADGLEISASLSSKCKVVTGLATQIHEKADGGSRQLDHLAQKAGQSQEAKADASRSGVISSDRAGATDLHSPRPRH